MIFGFSLDMISSSEILSARSCQSGSDGGWVRVTPDRFSREDDTTGEMP